MITIKPIPAFNDNYIWAIIAGGDAFLVDPGDASAAESFLHSESLSLKGLLITHHHPDHTGGIVALTKTHPDLRVYGPDNPTIDGITHIVRDGDTVNLLGECFNVTAVPGHTLDHIIYHNDKHCFCADTLFSAGCGRCFEGTFEMFYNSLQKIAALPDKILLYPAHEYTLANLKFAKAVEPNNPAINKHIQDSVTLRENKQPTLPTTLEREKTINPFLRTKEQDVINYAKAIQVNTSTPEAVFAILRQAKDRF